MNAVAAQAALLYDLAVDQLVPLKGGYFNDVYEFTSQGQAYVLRISPPNEDVDFARMQAILAWMQYLSAHGASIPRPLASKNQVLVETVDVEDRQYIITSFEKASGLLAENLPFDQWDERLFTNLGQAAGRLHALAKRYSPPSPELWRPDWSEMENCFHPAVNLDPFPAMIGDKLAAVQQVISALPKDPAGYGLVHTDLHAANFFIDLTAHAVTIFDFDDCSYGWYIMDTALLFFDLLVLYPGEDRSAFGRRFLAGYLPGYRSQTPLDPFWLEQLPHFLKLLELACYTKVAPFYNPDYPDAWSSKFMKNRLPRIENDIPYWEWAADDIPLMGAF